MFYIYMMNAHREFIDARGIGFFFGSETEG